MIDFIKSTDYESIVWNEILLEGNSDALAFMAGAIAEAFYGEIPNHIAQEALKRIFHEFIEVPERFNDRFG